MPAKGSRAPPRGDRNARVQQSRWGTPKTPAGRSVLRQDHQGHGSEQVSSSKKNFQEITINNAWFGHRGGCRHRGQERDSGSAAGGLWGHRKTKRASPRSPGSEGLGTHLHPNSNTRDSVGGSLASARPQMLANYATCLPKSRGL